MGPVSWEAFGHRCTDVHKAIKGEISEHLVCFRQTLSDSHGYNTRNGYLPRLF